MRASLVSGTLDADKIASLKMSGVRTFIALGSNLEDPQEQIERALTALSTQPSSTLIQSSSLYRSKAVGPGEQPDYINAVCELKTELPPAELLHVLQQIEDSQGRIRQQHWGPRTLDLDILLYGDIQLESQTLLIPHPRMFERNFVLYPLFEIAPELMLPGGLGLPKEVALESLLAQVSDANLERLKSDSKR